MTQPLKAEMFTPVLAWLDAGAPHVVPSLDEELFFNMEFFQDEFACGTVCCIAGAIDLFNGLGVSKTETPAGRNPADVHTKEVGRIVGMTPDQIEDLFMAGSNPNIEDQDDVSQIRPAEAAAAIRAMLETGKVVWGTTRPVDATR